MKNRLLHIYRNIPFGRETLLQSIYFCTVSGIELNTYIPKHNKFLMYFEHNAIQVDLDSSFLKDPNTAQLHMQDILNEMNASAKLIEPKGFSASNLPDIPIDFNFMTCPRSISDLSSKIGLGHIGSKVRKILLNASFPILIPSQVFKEWKSIIVLFGGSINGVNALQLGLKLSQVSGLPIDMFTQNEAKSKDIYEQVLKDKGIYDQTQSSVRNWYFFEKGHLSSNLFYVPHNALIIMGLFGHGLVKELIFGSTMELVQATMPNNLLLVGPEFKKHIWYEA